MKDLNQMSRISALKQDLESTKCISNGSFSKLGFGKDYHNAELILRQFLMLQIQNNFSKEILYSIGNSNSSISYPLPLEWSKVVNRHGFCVNRVESVVKLYFYVFLKFSKGIFGFSMKISRDLYHIISKDNVKKGRYVYFDNLSSRNFPLSSQNGPFQNIFTWYINWSNQALNLDSLCHNVQKEKKEFIYDTQVLPIPSVIPFITKINGMLRFFFWGLLTIFFCILDLIRGHWWNALLFEEFWKAKVFDISEDKELAEDYLFHNSNWIYRPLWSYVVENRGKRVLFYFYSTNCEGFKTSEGYSAAYFGWKYSTWSNILVWDYGQEEFIKRSIDINPSIYICGSIWFESGVSEIPILSKNAIAVFDVQPLRDGIYNTFGISIDFLIPLHCNQFLLDIYEVLLNLNLDMVLKRKRNVGNLVHYQYRNLIDELIKNKNFFSMDADVRAEQLIAQCEAVISMPFTSTALIGREMGKPSIYYFPNDLIMKDDRAAHGIPILIGRDELYYWLSEVLNRG